MPIRSLAFACLVLPALARQAPPQEPAAPAPKVAPTRDEAIARARELLVSLQENLDEATGERRKWPYEVCTASGARSRRATASVEPRSAPGR